MKTIIMFAGAAVFGLGIAGAIAQTLDADADGLVSFEEMLAVYPTMTEGSYAAIDTDADGMVSQEELAAAVEAGLVPATDG